MLSFLFGIPELFTPKPYKARRALQVALGKYYTAKHDQNEDTAQLIKVRAKGDREYNIAEAEIGKLEIAVLNASTSNAIPTLFWLICFICSNTDITTAIRDELLNIITTSVTAEGKREISIDTSKFDTDTPVFVSTYRETLRLADSQVSVRRATADTVISDGKNSYLLRKGVDIQIPAAVSQKSTAIWGPDALSFDARRFLKTDEKLSDRAKEDGKEQKRALVPRILLFPAPLLMYFGM